MINIGKKPNSVEVTVRVGNIGLSSVYLCVGRNQSYPRICID